MVGSLDPRSPEAKPNRRGTRIPDDWQPTTDDLAWASARGHDQVLDLADFTEAFRYYWQSTAKNPTKLDWSKTWRNCLRDEAGGKPRRRPATSPRLKAVTTVRDPEFEALMAKKIAAKKIAEEEEEARRARQRVAGI